MVRIPQLMASACLSIGLLLVAHGSYASGPEGGEPEEHREHEELWHSHPHHASVVLGGTFVEGEEGETIGVDYEYRLNQLLGLGAVLEYAADPIDAATVLFVADLHIWRGLAIQTGPGVERVQEESGEEEDVFVYRLGALYEVEFGRFTLSPQIHLDITDTEEAWVGAVAFGYAF